MKKKLFALLLLPLIAVSVFFGCDKDERSLEDTQSLYSSMIDSYITKNADGETVNSIFKNNKRRVDEGDTSVAEVGEKIMYITFGDNSESASEEFKQLYTATITQPTEDSILNQKKLYQYTSVYQAILSSIFECYENTQAGFFTSLKENEDVTKEDKNNLYYSLKEVSDELGTFALQKSLFEEDIRLLGVNDPAVSSSIDVMNYYYNNLLRKSFAFINTYIDLQNKYYPADATASYYASVVYYQSVVRLAEGVFHSNVLSMENIEYCNIEVLLNAPASRIIPEGSTTPTGITTNNFSYLLYEGTPEDIGFVNITEGIVSLRRCSIIYDDHGNYKTSLNENDGPKVTALAINNKNFQQQFSMYKKAWEGYPVYEYKCAEFEIENYSARNARIKNIVSFVNGLSFRNKACKNIIDTFEDSTIVAFASGLSRFV